ncbi:hypothetical protein Neosp_011966 [[Neocosmospora] mangrovei]
MASTQIPLQEATSTGHNHEGSNSPLPGGSRTPRQFPEDPFGGGILVADFHGHGLYRKDAYFQARLTAKERVIYEKQDVYLLAFELNFMRSFSPQYRFRGADIDIVVGADAKSSSSEPPPSITNIFPTGFAVHVSEREVQQTNEVAFDAGATPGPAQLNASVTQTHSDRTNFQGYRRFHGLIKGDNAASWRLYEEPESQSGIPMIFRIVTLVRCLSGGFNVELRVSTRMAKWPKLLGLHNLFFDSSYSARSYPQFIVQQDVPSNWRTLYEKVAKMILDGQGERHESKSVAGMTQSHDLDGEESRVFTAFLNQYQQSSSTKSFLAAWKKYLITHDGSEKFIRRLGESMAASVPDNLEASPERAAESAETEADEEEDEETKEARRGSMSSGVESSDGERRYSDSE